MNVREALDAYLALAGNPEIFDAPGSKDVAVLQLGANVSHFQSQVQLAAAIIAAKDAQIEALTTTNTLLRGRELPAPTTHPESDEEPIVSGILSVRPFEVKGIRIHLPEILRRLKRRL